MVKGPGQEVWGSDGPGGVSKTTGQNQTPAFLRRQKSPREAVRRPTAFGGFSLSPKSSQNAPNGFLEGKQHRQRVVSPSPPSGTERMRSETLGPRGQDTLQPTAGKSWLAWMVRKGFQNTAVYKPVLVNSEARVGGQGSGVTALLPGHLLVLRKHEIQIASPPQALGTRRTPHHGRGHGPAAVNKRVQKGTALKSLQNHCREK